MRWAVINGVVEILTHSFIFKGERGAQGDRGRPGEDGFKGAKVRTPQRGWFLAEMIQLLPQHSVSP